MYPIQIRLESMISSVGAITVYCFPSTQKSLPFNVTVVICNYQTMIVSATRVFIYYTNINDLLSCFNSVQSWRWSSLSFRRAHTLYSLFSDSYDRVIFAYLSLVIEFVCTFAPLVSWPWKKLWEEKPWSSDVLFSYSFIYHCSSHSVVLYQ